MQASRVVAEQIHQQSKTMSPASAGGNRLDVKALSLTTGAPISLTVDGGECVVIAGPSGSGKSRLLRAIADLEPGPADQGGVVALAGVDHLSYSGVEWRRQVAFLAAESQWWFDDVASHFAVPPPDDSLQALGLSARLLQQPVRRLSTGERQRLALLRLLAVEPRVLLLDEPTAALDPGSTRAVERVISAYRSRHQAAVLWVSHDSGQARRIADRYFYFVDGQLRESDVAAISDDEELS